ncbi:MAG: hypothetical protein Q8S17_05285, partial [Humidesulfovibrio sp.]|nr:hypothetical protein [Humidesulfovibrio sp.]
ELPDLDISLPDFSEPEPQAQADEDMGGDLNLSLAPEGLEDLVGADDLDAAPAKDGGQFLDTGELDITGLMDGGLMEGGMMEGLESPAEEPAAAQSLDAAALLDQIDDGPGFPEPTTGSSSGQVSESTPQGSLLDGLSLGDVSIGAAAAGAIAASSSAAAPFAAAEKAPAEAAPVPMAALQELREKLAALATQVMGGSVAVVRLEGQLAEKDQALAAMEQRLQSSHDEAHSLRRELSDLRSQLEETLRQRAQDSDKSATELKERLALVEDRQIQIDRDVRTEIERAVPREAARVIREEIAALAASMHEE